MTYIQDRVGSFMTRFSASNTQASRLLRELDGSDAGRAESWIAPRIMQDDDFKKIGYDYLKRDAQYLSGKKANAAYTRVMAQMTNDIIDEVYTVMPKDAPSAPT